MLTLILALSVLGCVDPAVTKDEEFSENEKGRVRGEETPDPAAAGSDVFIRVRSFVRQAKRLQSKK